MLEDTLDENLQAVNDEIAQLSPVEQTHKVKQQPKRQVLPANLARTYIHHEPDSTACQCGGHLKRIGEDVAEKLDHVPGDFRVKRHIRGKWACA